MAASNSPWTETFSLRLRNTFVKHYSSTLLEIRNAQLLKTVRFIALQRAFEAMLESVNAWEFWKTYQCLSAKCLRSIFLFVRWDQVYLNRKKTFDAPKEISPVWQAMRG